MKTILHNDPFDKETNGSQNQDKVTLPWTLFNTKRQQNLGSQQIPTIKPRDDNTTQQESGPVPQTSTSRCHWKILSKFF